MAISAWAAGPLLLLDRSDGLSSVVRSLITGAAGFIGSHVCGGLVADSHYVVTICDRGTPNVEAAREGGARLIFASSSSVYGDQECFPVTEDMEPRSRSVYEPPREVTSGGASPAFPPRPWPSAIARGSTSRRGLSGRPPGTPPSRSPGGDGWSHDGSLGAGLREPG
jgi:hypothetical protein